MIRTPEAPIPFPSEEREWIRIRSAGFDVISSASESQTRVILANFEALAASLGARAGAAPATVFVFSRRRESQPYFDLLFAREGSRATGAYVRHDGGGTMFLDASRGRRTERTALHELIHDVLRRRTDALPPLWLEEGLAEYFSNARVEGSRVIAGAPISDHLAFLRRQPELPVERVLTMKAEAPEASSSVFYAQSWVAVDWLFSLDSRAFFPFLDDLAGGTPVDAALRVHYGKAIDDLANVMQRRDYRRREVRLDTTVPSPSPPVSLDRATLLYELGRFLSHVAGAERESERHLEEALRIDPRHARTLAALGRYEQAVAAGPDDAEVHLLYAESLLSTAIGPFAGALDLPGDAAEKFRKARTLAQRALAIGGDEARARGLIGSSYLAEEDPSPAVTELERARELAPGRDDFALNLYAIYLRTGARAKADALFATVLEHARDKQTVFAARNVLLTEETARVNALAAEGRLDDAAAIVRELALATPDASARADLERQAAQLEATAAVNRHIVSYNEAISLVNAGRYRDAVKLLDKLLAEATDPQVVKDAKALRAEIAK